MNVSDVTAISLVSKKTREDICGALVPSVSRALTKQQAAFKRLPIKSDYIDWVIEDTDQLTVVLDQTDDACSILMAARGEETQKTALRLTNIAADLCTEFDVHTIFWNGAEEPIKAADFLAAGEEPSAQPETRRRVTPRKVRVSASRRRAQFAREAKLGNWVLAATRSHMMDISPEELESFELQERRAKSAPMRLSAWMFSLATACIALPLALPLIIHNLFRGEDVRSGAMAMGVASLYTALTMTGMASGFNGIL